MFKCKGEISPSKIKNKVNALTYNLGSRKDTNKIRLHLLDLILLYLYEINMIFTSSNISLEYISTSYKVQTF